MKWYAETLFTPYQLGLRREATVIVSKLPPEIDGVPVRCHELAVAVAELLDMPESDVCHGRYGLVEHSWLWARRFRDVLVGASVLDVYAVGRLPMVQLVEVGSPSLPNREGYEHMPGVDRRSDLRLDVVRKLVKIASAS